MKKVLLALSFLTLAYSNLQAFELTIKTDSNSESVRSSKTGRCSSAASEEICSSELVGSSCRRNSYRGTCIAEDWLSDGGVCTCRLDSQKMGIPQQESLPCVESNVYGKYAKGGGCNPYGCYPPNGSCNPYGCTLIGECDPYNCPQKIKTYKCYELN